MSSRAIRLFCLMWALQLCACSGDPPAFDGAIDERAIVITQVKHRGGTGEGMGFAIGDGKRIVTTRHLIVESSQEGTHRRVNHVSVFSPYYGDKFTARLIADDPDCDLAVLEVDWPGHPALELDSGKRLKPSDDLFIAGYPLPAEYDSDYKPEIQFDFVDVRDPGYDCRVQLSPGRFAGPGWSGAPVLDPKGKVVAVFHAKEYDDDLETLNLYASHSSRLKPLLDEANEEEAEWSPIPEADAVANREVFDLYARELHARRKVKLEALPLAMELVRLRPDSSGSHSTLASFLKLIDSATSSLNHIEKAVRLEPSSVNAHALYGHILKDLGKWEECIEAYNRAIEIDPQYPRLAKHLAESYLEQGQGQEAMGLLINLTEEYPDDGTFWHLKSEIEHELGQQEEALASLERAVAVYPEDREIQYDIAGLLQSASREEEAWEHIKEMLKHAKDDPRPWLLAAQYVVAHKRNMLSIANYYLDVCRYKRSYYGGHHGITNDSMETMKGMLNEDNLLWNGSFDLALQDWEEQRPSPGYAPYEIEESTGTRGEHMLRRWLIVNLNSESDNYVLYQTIDTQSDTLYDAQLVFGQEGEGALFEFGCVEGEWPGEEKVLYRAPEETKPWTKISVEDIQLASGSTTIFLRFSNRGDEPAHFGVDAVRVYEAE